jgi:hypothetical protein
MISKSTLDALRTSIVGVGLVEVSSVSFTASAPSVADIFDEGEKSGGLVMPVGDVASLSKNLGFLWDDNETARLLSMGARERVEQAFSLQTLGLSSRVPWRTRCSQGISLSANSSMTRWKVIHSPEIVVLLAAFPFLLRCIFWGDSSLMKVEVPKLTCVLVCTDRHFFLFT